MKIEPAGVRGRVTCRSRPSGPGRKVWTYTITSQPGSSDFGLPRRGMFFEVEREPDDHGGGWSTEISGAWQSADDVHFHVSAYSNSDGFDGALSRPTTIRLRESPDHKRVSFAIAAVVVADFVYAKVVAGVNLQGTIVCSR
ncbi:hypothetical protein [Streptomyces sp. NPDC048489]|uniref:hypothetical protein n=1 Tax=Streptomyces sp. NPDC048489 TaxID=3154504 RepID=UPI00342F7F10